MQEEMKYTMIVPDWEKSEGADLFKPVRRDVCGNGKCGASLLGKEYLIFASFTTHDTFIEGRHLDVNWNRYCKKCAKKIAKACGAGLARDGEVVV